MKKPKDHFSQLEEPDLQRMSSSVIFTTLRQTLKGPLLQAIPRLIQYCFWLPRWLWQKLFQLKYITLSRDDVSFQSEIKVASLPAAEADIETHMDLDLWSGTLAEQKFSISKHQIQSFVHRLRVEYGFSRFAIDLSLANPQQIKALNHSYRNKNTPTDVLSFRQLTFTKPGEVEKSGHFYGSIGRSFTHKHLGDVVICPQIVSKYALQTPAANTPKGLSRNLVSLVTDKLVFTISHGFLHLIGYDHENLDDQKIMAKEEQKCLAIWQNHKAPLVTPYQTHHPSNISQISHHPMAVSAIKRLSWNLFRPSS
ncbi:MAG: rRNA maturation RNase YbeY [Proteobacteria bacterium]|nr:rRNA maturation RNase YbeY [Pseudomonadota bacterium]